MVQTMCTNCNSANIDLGGLGGELLPLDVDGFPLIGGLMTIYALQVNGPLVSNIAVDKGPGDYEALPEAIGGSIHVSSPASFQRRRVTAIAESGSDGWGSAYLLGAWNHRNLMLGGQYVRSESQAIDANRDRFNETGELDRESGAVEARFRTGGGWQFSAKYQDIREDAPDGHGKFFAPTPPASTGTYGREDAFVEAEGWSFGVDGKLGENGRVSLRAMGFDRLHETLDQSVSPTQEDLDPVFTIDEEHRAYQLRYAHFITERGVQLSGAISRREQIDNVIAWQQTDPGLIRVRDTWESDGADIGITWQPAGRWSLRAGTRYDRFRWSDQTERTGLAEREESAFSPRAKLSVKPTDTWQLTFSAGYGARAPRPIYEEVCCGQRLSPTVDVDLEESRALAFDVQWQPSTLLRVGMYLHHTELDNHILRMVGTSLIGIQTYALGNIPEAVLQGATVTSRVRTQRGFTADLSFTALDTDAGDQPTIANHFLPIGPSQIYRHEFDFDEVPYIAQRSGSLQLGWSDPAGRFDALLQAQYQGAVPIQTWYADFASVTNGNCKLSGPSGSLDPQLCVRDGLSDTESFWVFNLRGSVRLSKWLRLHLGVDNATEYIQSDLFDPANDYNWGPIRGRYYYGGLTFTY